MANGLGGYASGTAADASTRRMHALLTAAGPHGRLVTLLLRLDERLQVRGDPFELSSHPFRDGVCRLNAAPVSFERTPWLNRFKGRSLVNPSAQGWAVRKDGGEFDQFTGATITPRAIVSMVRRSLEFYANRRDLVFSQPSQP